MPRAEQLDSTTARAFARAFADPEILKSVEVFLLGRRAELEKELATVAQRALFDEKAKPSATVLFGQLREVNSWLDIVGRYVTTGNFDTSKLKFSPHTP